MNKHFFNNKIFYDPCPLNANFDGIELSQEYVDIANKRLCQSNLLTEIENLKEN